MNLNTTSSRMSKHSIILVLAAIVIFALLLMLLEGRQRQPTFQGKSVDYWLEQVFWAPNLNQTEALQAIKGMGTNAYPFLVAALKKKDTPVKMFYQWTYRKMPANVQKRFPVPVPASTYREAASLVLLNSNAKGILPELIEILKIPDSSIRYSTMIVVSYHIGQENVAAVPVLLETLSDTNLTVRQRAAGSLGKIGPGAKAAIPRLKAMLTDKDENVRLLSMKAIWQISHETNVCLPVMEQLLGGQKQYTRHWAAVYLNEVKPDAEKTIPILIASLESSNISLQMSAANALLRFGDQAKSAVPGLLKLSQGGDYSLREAAKAALNKIDPENSAEKR